MSKNTDLGSLINYIKGQVTGRLNAPAYTSATAFTGTIAGYLGFDTSGNILTSGAVGLSGSGTTNYISKWTASTALGNSLIFDNGTNVGINTNNPQSKLHTVLTGSSFTPTNTGTIGGGNSTRVHIQSNEPGLMLSSDANSLGTPTGTQTFQFGLQLSTYGSGDWRSQIYFGSTPLTFVYSGDQGANVSERMRISTSGNVSIGNTNNTYKLDVTGDVNISGTYRVNGTAIGSGVTGSGSTNFMPLWTSTTGLGDSIIYNSGGNLGINSTTNGYTLNAIRSASTAFSDTFKGTGGTIQIMARIMQDESTKKGIAIGYNASFSYSAIFGTQDGANLRIGVLSGSLYKAMIVLSTNTVSMDLPTSGGGLTSGMLYNDGGTVKIIT
jgi:hypothetical protein